MGICESKEVRELRKKNMMIEKQLMEEQLKMGKDIKILLLGTGESGKSTIVKQMKIIHMNGYTQDELLAYKTDIYRNIINSMQQIIDAMNKLQVQFTDARAEECVSTMLDSFVDLSTRQLPNEITDSVKYLWDHCGIKNLFDRLTQVTYVIDSAPYFFNEIDRIGAASYVPNVQDVLRARIKTTGISESRFKMGLVNIHMFDVGGQRSERKKWIHCFENVTSVIFCVALSEYDQMLIEEASMNRMLESFRLFEDIVNSKWFMHSSIILFLNKIDIFEKKIQISPLSEYFEDYKGGANFKAATDFLKSRFLALNHSKLLVYPHLTCATDTKQIELVFAAVKETILAKALKMTGIM